MKLDEAIQHLEEVSEENENVVITGTFKDGHTVAEMYCDDTECVEHKKDMEIVVEPRILKDYFSKAASEGSE